MAVPYGDQPAAPTAYDLDLADLRRYCPDRDEPADFDLFWKQTLAAHQKAPSVLLSPCASGLSTLDVEDMTFAGFGGQPVKAWLVRPSGASGPLPCVVQYVGYNDGRGLPTDHLLWASAGYAHLVMDARGQGGETPDRPLGAEDDVDGPPVVRGLLDPAGYYYRRVYIDAVRAVDSVRGLPGIDPGRIVVAGGSQGGGTALAVAALAPERVAAVLCDVPFMCHWNRGVRVSDRGPYAEVARYLARHRDRSDAVLATLRYFDGVSFAARATAPALFSVGLTDRVCPPSTVYAAYNHYAGDKRMVVWEFNGHEGGGGHQIRQQLDYVREVLSPRRSW
jgi:cephalosporin-C deacetylase